MENQNELKWYQKPEGVIALLILFFPVGLYLMWKNEHWTKRTRWIVTAFFVIAILVNNNSNNSSIDLENVSDDPEAPMFIPKKKKNSWWSEITGKAKYDWECECVGKKGIVQGSFSTKNLYNLTESEAKELCSSPVGQNMVECNLYKK